MPDGQHTATVYLQVVPKTRRSGDRVIVTDLDIAAMTKNAPSRPTPGSVTVKLNLTLPDAVFLPLSPEVSVEIPAHGVEVAPLVEAESVPVPVEPEEDDRG